MLNTLSFRLCKERRKRGRVRVRKKRRKGQQEGKRRIRGQSKTNSLNMFQKSRPTNCLSQTKLNSTYCALLYCTWSEIFGGKRNLVTMDNNSPGIALTNKTQLSDQDNDKESFFVKSFSHLIAAISIFFVA